ncbi:MAG: L,D-transpeptidase [Candidatus Amulumruptor sp.]|nr:L,D-transpeptidase [Candidatus Amulumruptor sp.]
MRKIFIISCLAAVTLCASSNVPQGVEVEAPESPVPDSVAPCRAVVDSIVIDKASMTLSAYRDGVMVCRFDVATGRIPGNKVGEGDMRTPEGRFTISEIVDASEWTHDFGDGLGEIEGCYGPWFMRLDTPPHTGIGIHGTHDPASLGHRASEGCIRLLNENCDSLCRIVTLGTPVTILPGAPDCEMNRVIADALAAQPDTTAVNPS